MDLTEAVTSIENSEKAKPKRWSMLKTLLTAWGACTLVAGGAILGTEVHISYVDSHSANNRAIVRRITNNVKERFASSYGESLEEPEIKVSYRQIRSELFEMKKAQSKYNSEGYFGKVMINFIEYIDSSEEALKVDMLHIHEREFNDRIVVSARSVSKNSLEISIAHAFAHKYIRGKSGMNKRLHPSKLSEIAYEGLAEVISYDICNNNPLVESLEEQTKDYLQIIISEKKEELEQYLDGENKVASPSELLLAKKAIAYNFAKEVISSLGFYNGMRMLSDAAPISGHEIVEPDAYLKRVKEQHKDKDNKFKDKNQNHRLRGLFALNQSMNY